MPFTRKPTAFEQRVYDALCRVPSGKIVTYKTLGNAVGCNSGQAIGQAMRRNPFAPEVPCHRVLPATLKLGGYQGELEGESVKRKMELLSSEGVRFDEKGVLINKNCVLHTIPE